jgi:multidrug resistance protein, MATE family
MSPFRAVDTKDNPRYLPETEPSSPWISSSPTGQEPLSGGSTTCPSDVEDEIDMAIPLFGTSDPNSDASSTTTLYTKSRAYGTVPVKASPQKQYYGTYQDIQDSHIPIQIRSQGQNAFTRFFSWITGSRSDQVVVADEAESLLYAKSVETAPLLVQVREISYPVTPIEECSPWDYAEDPSHTTWQKEAKLLAQYSGPLIVTFLLHYSVTLGSVFTVGRIGMAELGAVNRKCLPTTHEDANNKESDLFYFTS